MTAPRRISVLGSTGSVGDSALCVVEAANAEARAPIFEIEALAAGRDTAKLADQARRTGARLAVVADETRLDDLRARLEGTGIECAAGAQAVVEAAERPCDRVVAAIVGSAGLPSTYAAVKAGNSVALANKESVVCAGELILSEARRRGVDVIPCDSEHNALFQVFENPAAVERITITASGGPFRDSDLETMRRASPEQARAHPIWDMGLKISIDSATMFNKALEFVEAAYLFDMPGHRIDVLLHPQSTIHGMVHYKDGSVLAQLGCPDMRTPIAHAIMWPERVATESPRLDLAALGCLTFGRIDAARFPAVELAREAVRHGAGAPTVLNCANEAAVSAFIAGECGFLDISSTVDAALDRYFGGTFNDSGSCASLDDVLALEDEARRVANEQLDALKRKREGAAV